ncbi:MAG TPA: coniferyl aldehyde dehydrogenase [Burkholderiaceae bacterium]|nr:coniferyl aldehyde dehydrogenase [Burkholderiaceae bacterium]
MGARTVQHAAGRGKHGQTGRGQRSLLSLACLLDAALDGAGQRADYHALTTERNAAMNAFDMPAALRDAFEDQRRGCAREPFPHWRVRRERLLRLDALLRDQGDRIEAAIDADFGGRPRMETQLLEVFPALVEIKSALRGGRHWMRPRRAAMSKWFLPARAQVVPQPLGVVGIIVPWNYPLYLSVGPLVGALAAGNRAMLKLSEYTPAFSEWFAAALAERFDADEVFATSGDAELAAAFSCLPFDHLVFTGSTAVGRRVMAAAAENLTALTLELGGKSPAIVTAGYPLEHAVERILTGKLLNAGQTCIAPDYALVPRDQCARFVELARAAARRMYPAGLDDTNYCSVINARHFTRLVEDLDEARSTGATVEALFEGAQSDHVRHRLAPQLLLDAAAQSRVLRDEIFGPLLPVLAYDTLDDALDYVRARARPLALYWFDRDEARIQRMLQSTHAGGVTVNDVILHIAPDSLPFGGVGASGFGHYHGRWGFDSLSKLKPVFRQSRLNALGLFQAPYRPLAQRMLGWMKRF